MNILYIAPLPPPITGHSLVSQVLFEELESKHVIEVVDLKKKSFKEGIDGISRIVEITSILGRIFVSKSKTEVIYLTVSESLAGNIKDLLIYAICFFRLKTMVIHLHGGTIRKELWDKRKWIFRLNRFFIRKIGGVIISGDSHLKIFSDFVKKDRIHIINNFALDCLFAKQEVIHSKFKSNHKVVRILYMSNMIRKKGYMQLLNAFLKLDKTEKSNLKLDFVGAFDSESSKESFIKAIGVERNITYHGVVNDKTKKELFHEAHIFCLPSSYFEGQPISILEAYASGCVVLTTGQPGILDIFEDGVNGFQISSEPDNITTILLQVIKNKEKMKKIALENNLQATLLYRKEKYNESIRSILEEVNMKNKKIRYE